MKSVAQMVWIMVIASVTIGILHKWNESRLANQTPSPQIETYDPAEHGWTEVDDGFFLITSDGKAWVKCATWRKLTELCVNRSEPSQ